jgi:cation diffusion facilitator CzcD-associated flavoprotein CzcO
MSVVEVAIIGAGPYGLSLAAHLRSAGLEYRQFGTPMGLWQDAMPRGMYLKSEGFASNLSDPEGTHTLEAFCSATHHPYAKWGLPVPLDTFVGYGHWFQSQLGLEVEAELVSAVTQCGNGFELRLGNGDYVLARKVIVAIGVAAFAHIPDILSGLPRALCTHSSAHVDPAAFRGRRVVIIGAGQSALELAALMHENDVSAQVLARRQVFWNGAPLPLQRSLAQRLREPEAGLGSGWRMLFYSNHPDLFRLLPRATRVSKARTVLGPAGAVWLRGRFEGQVPVLAGAVRRAEPLDGGLRLGVERPDGTRQVLEADHVIAGTGYRVDVARLTFLSEAVRSRLRTISRSPEVGPDYQSSIAGLYFIGPAVAPTFGPVMRFVHGSRHAAATVARSLADTPARTRSRAVAVVGNG